MTNGTEKAFTIANQFRVESKRWNLTTEQNGVFGKRTKQHQSAFQMKRVIEELQNIWSAMGLMPEQAIKMMQPAMDKCKSFSAFADKIGKVNWAELYGDLPELDAQEEQETLEQNAIWQNHAFSIMTDQDIQEELEAAREKGTPTTIVWDKSTSTF
jgi:hypothetical protein